MHFITRASVAASLLVASVAVASGGPQGNVENGKNIFENGKGDVVPACNTCHGAGGEDANGVMQQPGMGDDFIGAPRLAGLGYAFVVKQLQDFATDKRMDETAFIMNANAKAMTEEERRDVAAYVNSLDPLPLATSDMNVMKDALELPVGVRYLGKGLAQYGAPDRGIPACHSCHGYNGRGAAPMYPAIGGQRYPYLVNQLKKWRDGSRSNDPMGQMQAVAQKMTDEDIYNVATFLTSAPRTTMGNARVPGEFPH